MTEGVELGPMVNEAAQHKIQGLVDDALSLGAKIAAQGPTPDGSGWYYPATVLTDVPEDAELLRTEVFGPVAPILTYRDEDEMLARANGSEQGLASYVYSGSLERALRVADRLEAGMVGLNRGLISDPAAPFGGVKQSGLGREGGREGIDAFLETKYIAVDWPNIP
jgi:succinate-semialdehyde dehydrogenase/glutarate-semialdehyde dehydrogenase